MHTRRDPAGSARYSSEFSLGGTPLSDHASTREGAYDRPPLYGTAEPGIPAPRPPAFAPYAPQADAARPAVMWASPRAVPPPFAPAANDAHTPLLIDLASEPAARPSFGRAASAPAFAGLPDLSWGAPPPSNPFGSAGASPALAAPARGTAGLYDNHAPAATVDTAVSGLGRLELDLRARDGGTTPGQTCPECGPDWLDRFGSFCYNCGRRVAPVESPVASAPPPSVPARAPTEPGVSSSRRPTDQELELARQRELYRAERDEAEAASLRDQLTARSREVDACRSKLHETEALLQQARDELARRSDEAQAVAAREKQRETELAEARATQAQLKQQVDDLTAAHAAEVAQLRDALAAAERKLADQEQHDLQVRRAAAEREARRQQRLAEATLAK